MQTGSKESLDALAGFFNELAPRLETARALDRELDRKLAHRFNVVDYLKRNELGLSRIIADLLDPTGSHGQGELFLRAFLERLEGFRETLRWPDLDSRTSVRCEEKITGERRIDVVVEIKGPAEETHSMVLENKPYAHDQESQVKDYLESRKKDDWYLLIYLSPRGSGPSEESIPKGELKKWGRHFAVMPYVKGPEERKDEFDGFRLPHSLADWLGECRKNCEVERLRWFLRDMETFCQRRFGGQAMTTDFEAKAVEDYVLLDSDRLKTAEAVYESWPEIKNGVCRTFLERLRSDIALKAKSKFSDDIRVKSEYAGEGKYSNSIWLYRKAWAQ